MKLPHGSGSFGFSTSLSALIVISSSKNCMLTCVDGEGFMRIFLFSYIHEKGKETSQQRVERTFSLNWRLAS